MWTAERGVGLVRRQTGAEIAWNEAGPFGGQLSVFSLPLEKGWEGLARARVVWTLGCGAGVCEHGSGGEASPNENGYDRLPGVAELRRARVREWRKRDTGLCA